VSHDRSPVNLMVGTTEMKKANTIKLNAWPESARRYVKALQRALEECRAERAHYISIVEEHEYEWDEDALLCGQVEALRIANDELKTEREGLHARLSERTAELERCSAQLASLASELTLAEHRERRRVAQYVHDHLQQLLCGAKMQTANPSGR
jgi:signal transduction histidine kinase